MSDSDNKEYLRQVMKTRLKAMSAAERADWSRVITDALADHPTWQSAQTVAVFDPLPAEPDLMPLLARDGAKTYAFPRCDGVELRFHAVSGSSDLLPVPRRRYGEPDPERCPLVPPEAIDLVLVPGLAFVTQTGERLGRGGGFYDRLLADLRERVPAIGVCFSLQLLPELPAEPHDMTVAEVITELTPTGEDSSRTPESA